MKNFCYATFLFVAILMGLAACQAASAPPTLSPTAVVSAPTVAAPTIAPRVSTAVPPTRAATATNELPTAKILAEWKINMPEDIVFGFDSVWVPSRRTPNVTTRIDPVTNKIIAVIPETGFLAKSALVTADAVWVAGQSNDLAPINPKTNTVGAKVQGNHPRIAFGFNSIWAVGHQGEPLDRVDPATGKIIVSIPLEGRITDRGEENDLLVTASAVWVITNGELLKIDPATNKIVLRTTLDKVVAEAKAQSNASVGKGTDVFWWGLEEGLIRVDANTGVGLTLQPKTRGAIAVTNDAVWVADYAGHLSRMNIATNEIDATYKISPGATRVVTGLGSVWLAYSDAKLVQRLELAP